MSARQVAPFPFLCQTVEEAYERQDGAEAVQGCQQRRVASQGVAVGRECAEAFLYLSEIGCVVLVFVVRYGIVDVQYAGMCRLQPSSEVDVLVSECPEVFVYAGAHHHFLSDEEVGRPEAEVGLSGAYLRRVGVEMSFFVVVAQALPAVSAWRLRLHASADDVRPPAAVPQIVGEEVLVVYDDAAVQVEQPVVLCRSCR